ncbi:hypothetical protein OCOL_000976 [Ordospora colligata]|uniref:K Homology domain-containing protein n=1 Tax=Ordospora colligata OC4 TaxID=1354746 RepID=A0A0B2UKV3_9MICR|nr:uncharacterized protein M896_040630 [Ordospora colligata OC4]KHN69869.1 hypothetical protein M896_040630 [Ordospora colligata OC4]TBU16039.1 hypothetical protein CWI41_040630 [Ordospora colligata]TBU16252.1 hypothetical protein CWI40_040630 [Ordospora colligata]
MSSKYTEKTIPEPEDICLTSTEFLEVLGSKYKAEIQREYNLVQFSNNPSKYERQGLNAYLEPDTVTQEEIVIPSMHREELERMACESRISVGIDKLNKDPGIMIILVKGTQTAIASFKRLLGSIHNHLPNEIKDTDTFKLIDIPYIMEDSIIGKNGTNIYKIQRDFNVALRIISGEPSYKTLLVSGENIANVQDACKCIMDILYKNAN